jgi:hypothetical protein
MKARKIQPNKYFSKSAMFEWGELNGIEMPSSTSKLLTTIKTQNHF